MLKKIGLFLMPALAALAFYACQSELSGEGIPVPVPTTSGWSNQAIAANQHPARLQLNKLQPDSQTFVVNMNTGGSCNCTGGTRCLLGANIFEKLDGSAVTGPVTVIIKEARTFAEMIAFGLGTVTADKLLATGGMVQISARQGTDPLRLKAGKTIEIKMPTPFLPDYKGFAGSASGNIENPVTWTENPAWQVRNDTLQGGGSGINIQIDSIGWINCDRFYNEPNPTNIYLKLPEAYGNTNTSCFIIFRTDKVMSGLFGDGANKRFWQGSYYKVPAGKLVRLIAVSKKDNKIFYGSADVTITPDMTVNITQLDEVTENELKIRLNSL
jgi:hypothetical protein